MNRYTKFAAAAAVLALAACGSKSPRQDVPDCTFGDNPTQAAPQWVCPPHAVEGQKDTGFGSHPKSGAGFQFSLDQAAAKARAQLAAQVKARTTQMIRDAVATMGSGTSETVNRAASSATQQITSETLVGSKVVRSTTDAKGNVYVVVGMDLEASNRRIQEALNTSMRDDPAAWQAVQGNRSPAQMQAEIMKMGDRR